MATSRTNPSTAQATWQLLKYLFWLFAVAAKVWSSKLLTAIVKVLKGTDAEREKSIISSSWRAALGKCTIHMLPVSATITLTYLNLNGFFIGSDYTGLTPAAVQAVDRLCLQVTAKLFELFIIASMGVIVLDIIREKLLFGSEGVPLGLVLAKDRFGELSYLFSRELRAGICGFRRWRTRLLFASLIIVCALIALFAGPSAALLLLPSYYTAWPAGGVSFWMNGDLFPTILDTTTTDCSTWERNSTMLNSLNFTAVSCPWAGYYAMHNAFEQQAYVLDPHLIYEIGSFEQDIGFSWGGPGGTYPDAVRQYAVGSNIAIAAFSRFMSWSGWDLALFNAPQTQSGGRLWNLRYRAYNGTKGSVQSKLPLVRTQCFQADNWPPDEDMIASTPEGQVLLPFPIIPDFGGNVSMRYFLPVTLLDTTQLATQWIPIPQGPSQTSFGPPISHYPSAFLVIQNPGIPGSSSTITCSVQAHWITGFNVASGVAWGLLWGSQEQGAVPSRTDKVLGEWLFPPNLAVGDDSAPEFNQHIDWDRVSLTDNWLRILTPSLNNSVPGSTTLASVLRTVLEPGFSSSLDPVLDAYNLTLNAFSSVNNVLGAFIVDGMSRIGWNENNCDMLEGNYVYNQDDPNLPDCYWNFNSAGWPQIFRKILAGTAVMSPCTAHPASTVGRSYYWSASVEGYGIKADSIAYYLALTVLFTHLLLALFHVAWTLFRRRTSFTWTSATDLLALGLLSTQPDDKLKDTSSGIDSNKTLKLQLRIRDIQPVPVGREQVQLLLDSVNGKQVNDSQEYGAQR